MYTSLHATAKACLAQHACGFTQWQACILYLIECHDNFGSAKNTGF